MSSTDFPIELEEFDDGHSPGGTHVKTKVAKYLNKNSEQFLAVFDNLLSNEWCDRAYNFAINRMKPWGTYVTMIDALDSLMDADALWRNNEHEKAIALMAVRALIVDRGNPFVGKDRANIHGTAVWCLSSGQYDEVKYHIDYAELFRYETNVIYPPIYAGTWQVAPVYSEEDMLGGAFKVNTGGLDHYKRFGYKCRLSTAEAFEKDEDSAGWITINYNRNRGIFHDGNFPHYAAEIKHIRPGLNRVILGFNCFPAELAECNMRAPEHSDAFNRTIKLYQKLAALGHSITIQPNEKESMHSPEDVVPEKKTRISAKDIMKNPGLAKLLVRAAKNVKAAQEKDAAKQSVATCDFPDSDVIRAPK